MPVDGFWSISLYNGDGYYQMNDFNAYSLNNITSKKNADGSVAIQFGGCDGKIPELLADHEWLELHGSALSRPPRNPERNVEVPRTAASELNCNKCDGLTSITLPGTQRTWCLDDVRCCSRLLAPIDLPLTRGTAVAAPGKFPAIRQG